MLGSDSSEILVSALYEADELKRRGQFLAALELLNQAALRRFAAIGDGTAALVKPSPLDLMALENLADLAILFDQTDAANDLLEGIGLWYERAGNRYFADYFAVKRMHLTLDCGRLHEAYDILRSMEPSIGNPEAIDFSEAGLDFWERRISWPATTSLDRVILFSRLYLEMGRVLASFGQYRESLAAIERGLAHAEQAPAEIAGDVTPHLKVARAAALLEQGDLEQARGRLAELHDELSDRQRPGLYLRHLELAGKLGLLTGELGDALEQFRLALRTCAEFGFEKMALIESLNLAHVLIYLNHTAAARDILLESRKRAAALNDRVNVVRADFLLQLAQARGQSLAAGVPIAPSVSESWGVVNDAAPDQRKGEPVDPFDLPQSDNYLSFFEDRALGFHWLLGRRDFSGAANYLGEISQVFESSDSALIALRLRVMRAMLAYYRDDLGLAGRLFEELRRPLGERGLKPELWQAQRFLGWCWTRLAGHDGKARQEMEEETQRLLDEMTSSLAPEDQAVFRLNKWTEDEERLANEIHGLAVLKAEMETGSFLLRPQRRWRLMKRLHRLIERIDGHKDTLARRGVGGEDSAEKRDTRISLVRRLLTHSRDRVTLSFLVLPDQALIIRAGWMTLDFGICPITRLQIRNLVRRWHELIRRLLENSRGLGALPPDIQPARIEAESPDQTGAEATAKAEAQDFARQGQVIANHLAAALRIPEVIASLPKRIRALTIVPDDSLHGFPFAAIVHDNQYLIERFALSLAFESHSRRAAGRHNGVTESLAAGVSRASSSGIPGIAERIHPLPGAPKELDAIVAWFDKHRCRAIRLDDSRPDCAPASKAALLDLLPRADLFHIACHGIFKADAPDQSGLLLIPQPDEVEMLTLRELSALNLTRMRHATLSSCWSADHFILPGRWVISLPETLWRAGAQSVLGCLWVVNDDLASDFMRQFHAYLEEHPRDEALRRAQLDFLHDKDRAASYYWAGYNLYGDHSRFIV